MPLIRSKTKMLIGLPKKSEAMKMWTAIMGADKESRIKEAEKMRLCAQMLRSEQFGNLVKANASRFHEVLSECQDRKWIHYTQLAEKTEYSTAQTNRWCRASNSSNPTSTKWLTMKSVLSVVADMLEEDAKRLLKGEELLYGEPAPRAKKTD